MVCSSCSNGTHVNPEPCEPRSSDRPRTDGEAGKDDGAVCPSSLDRLSERVRDLVETPEFEPRSLATAEHGPFERTPTRSDEPSDWTSLPNLRLESTVHCVLARFSARRAARDSRYSSVCVRLMS